MDAAKVGRMWVDGPRTVGLAARGRRVVAVVARPSADGARWCHQVQEVTVDRVQRLQSPPQHDCTDPTVLPDGCVAMLSDLGQTGGPRQVVECAPNGEQCVRTQATGGVEAYAVCADRLVAIERMAPTAQPWQATVAVAGRLPPRFWDGWLTEDVRTLVSVDRRSGVRRVLDTTVGPLRSDAELVLSPDGRRLACTLLRAGADGMRCHGIELRQLSGRRTTQELWGPPCSDHTHLVFSPDGEKLAFVRHTRPRDGHGRRQLFVYSIATGHCVPVAAQWPGWLLPVAWTEAHGLVCRALVAGRWGVFAVGLEDSEPHALDAGQWSWDAIAVGDRVFGLATRLQCPPRVLPVDAPAPPSVQAEWSAKMVCPALFWPSRRPGPQPLVVLVHGGPVSAWTDAHHPRQPAAFFHQLGAHVLMPNPAGSTGHGDAHVEAIWHDWDQCTDQLIALLHQAHARSDVSTVAVVGGSFGGWAVLRLGSRADTPPLAALVAHAAIFDHTTMLAGCDEPAAFRWHLGPGTDALERASPARHVPGWSTPTLLLHGACDFNVPVEQALAAQQALAAHGVDHRLVVFPAEGHHIRTPRAEARWWSEIAAFLQSRMPRLGAGAGS